MPEAAETAPIINPPTVSAPPANSQRWIVTFAGTGINLALGVLYTWSMFKESIAKDFNF